VSYTDSRVGLVLEELDKSGFADDTIIVLLGDHGMFNDWKLDFYQNQILHHYVEAYIELTSQSLRHSNATQLLA